MRMTTDAQVEDLSVGCLYLLEKPEDQQGLVDLVNKMDAEQIAEI